MWLWWSLFIGRCLVEKDDKDEDVDDEDDDDDELDFDWDPLLGCCCPVWVLMCLVIMSRLQAL